MKTLPSITPQHQTIDIKPKLTLLLSIIMDQKNDKKDAKRNIVFRSIMSINLGNG